jgi:hypothetical protein
MTSTMGSCSPGKKGLNYYYPLFMLLREKKKKNIVSGNGFSMHRPLEVKMLVLLFPQSVMRIRGGSDRVCSFVELGTTSNVSRGCKKLPFSTSQTMKVRTACKVVVVALERQLLGVKICHFGKVVLKRRLSWV